MRVRFLPHLCPPQMYFDSWWSYLTHPTYPCARSAESAYVRIGLQNSGAFGTATIAKVAFPDMAGLYTYDSEGESKGLGLISDYGKDGERARTPPDLWMLSILPVSFLLHDHILPRLNLRGRRFKP